MTPFSASISSLSVTDVLVLTVTYVLVTYPAFYRLATKGSNWLTAHK